MFELKDDQQVIRCVFIDKTSGLISLSQVPKRRWGNKKLKKSQPTLITLIAVVILATLIIQTYQPQNTVQAENSPNMTFSIVWISDTQHLPEYYPTYYTQLCNWIVNHQAEYNVQIVVHTGDIVDTEGNQTQWINANKSMSVLLNNNVPYCWVAGNHDFNSTCWIGNQYAAFNTSIMEQKPYWVSSADEGLSTAVHFNVSGWDCLIVNIGYLASNETLAWAENLINAYPDSHIIVTTHAYVDLSGNYKTEWSQNLKTMLDKYANVFLTLSGHYYPTSGVHVKSGDRDELMFNMQEGSVYDLIGGAAARILTFDLQKSTISVQTYAVYSDSFLTDSNNNFTFSSYFRNNAVPQNNQTEASPEFPWLHILVVIAVVIAVPSLIYVVWLRRHKN